MAIQKVTAVDVKKEGGFTMTLNETTKKIKNLDARAVYGYLMERDGKWNPNVKDLARHFHATEKRIHKALKYLEGLGLYFFKKVKDKLGQFVWLKEVYSKPTQTTKPILDHSHKHPMFKGLAPCSRKATHGKSPIHTKEREREKKENTYRGESKPNQENKPLETSPPPLETPPESKPNQELKKVEPGQPVVFSLEIDNFILGIIREKSDPATWPLDRINQRQWLKEIEYNYTVKKPDVKTPQHRANSVCSILEKYKCWNIPGDYKDLEAEAIEKAKREAKHKALLEAQEKAHRERFPEIFNPGNGSTRKAETTPASEVARSYLSKLRQSVGASVARC